MYKLVLIIFTFIFGSTEQFFKDSILRKDVIKKNLVVLTYALVIANVFLFSCFSTKIRNYVTTFIDYLSGNMLFAIFFIVIMGLFFYTGTLVTYFVFKKMKNISILLIYFFILFLFFLFNIYYLLRHPSIFLLN